MKNEMLKQRKFLGILGTILPILVTISRLITTKSLSTLHSISGCHYFHDYLLFEGIIVAVGIFLIYYRGYDIKDWWLSTVAGICAILLAFSPCSLPHGIEIDKALIGRNILNLPLIVTEWTHNITALLFFIFLAVIIVHQFTKSNSTNKSKEKCIRNKIYISCGIIMLLAIFIGGAVQFLFRIEFGVFIGEAIGLLCFGIAWLIKGEILLKDRN